MSSDQFQKNSIYVETPEASVDGGKNLDDKERDKRTGTWVTASARIITAAIGSGVLSLAWAFAQVGWVAGPAVLLAFSFVAYFTSTLLADSYRSPDPVHGESDGIFFEAVRSVLGRRKSQLFRLAVCVNLISVTIGSTITASINMGAVRSNCYRKHGLCYRFVIIFACIQIVLSQKPNFHKLSWLSIVKAVMAFAYSFIGLGLSIAKAPGGGPAQASLTGAKAGAEKKVWRPFQAIGNIAYAYADPYSNELIEIQDTLKSSPPENKVMKRASLIGISTTTLFYMLCGTLGYAAFGNDTPGNFLTEYKPFWLIDLANVCVAVHLIWEYQVYIKQTKMHRFSFKWTLLMILSWACLIVSIISAAGSIQGLVQEIDLNPFEA